MLQLRAAVQHRCNNVPNHAKPLILCDSLFSIIAVMGLNSAKSLMRGAAPWGRPRSCARACHDPLHPCEARPLSPLMRPAASREEPAPDTPYTRGPVPAGRPAEYLPRISINGHPIHSGIDRVRVGAGLRSRLLVAGTNFQFICLFEGRSEKGPELN